MVLFHPLSSSCVWCASSLTTSKRPARSPTRSAWLREKYTAEFGGDKTQVIHTGKTGEVSKKELEDARKAVREVDQADSPINAIVSVLMLREGWDVRNVTVVVGLRPYTAKANILPEQAIGRGLRLMFRDTPVDFTERVDIIGNHKFLDFVDDLEELEDLKLDTFEVGKDKLKILTILPLENRKEYDVGLPVLSPTLVRKKTLAEEIAGLEVMSFDTMLLPLSADDPRNKTFKYDGYDIITLEKLVERDYTMAGPQTAQDVIGYYSRRIAERVKLPSPFAALRLNRLLKKSKKRKRSDESGGPAFAKVGHEALPPLRGSTWRAAAALAESRVGPAGHTAPRSAATAGPGRVGHLANPAQGMVLRDALFRIDIAEHGSLLLVVSSHVIYVAQFAVERCYLGRYSGYFFSDL
jgi:hypothetical protein